MTSCADQSREINSRVAGYPSILNTLRTGLLVFNITLILYLLFTLPNHFFIILIGFIIFIGCLLLIDICYLV